MHARKDAPVAHSEADEFRQTHKPGDDRNTLGAMFASLTWPLVLGLGATAGFYWLIYRGPFHHPLVLRYFAGHPINMIETALFFIGLVALYSSSLNYWASSALFRGFR